MGEDGPYASILLLLLILLIDQFFYRFAAAIPQLNAKELFRKTVEENDKKSGRLMRITTHPTDFTNTMLLVVTLNHLGAGIFFFPIWQKNILAFLKWVSGVGQTPSALLSVLSGIIAMLLFLYVLLLFGMILPQKLSLRNPAKFATAWVNVAYAVILLLWPFTKAANAFAQGLTKLFGTKKTSDANDVTDEIIHMVNEGHEQGLIQASEAEMIHNIFDFADKEAQDIMTPRSQVIVVDGKQSLEEVVAFILEESNSRFPVYTDDTDSIVGVLHLRDALLTARDPNVAQMPLHSIEGLLRQPSFVPQTKHIDELFAEMQRDKVQMIIVIDEYGQMDGLVTMEDILEEIVGNILDEYDEDVAYVEQKGQDEYVVEGMTPLRELEEYLDISFEEEEFDTLNGFLIARMDKIPQDHERFEMDAYGYHFEVLEVLNKRIASVRITKTPKV